MTPCSQCESLQVQYLVRELDPYPSNSNPNKYIFKKTTVSVHLVGEQKRGSLYYFNKDGRNCSIPGKIYCFKLFAIIFNFFDRPRASSFYIITQYTHTCRTETSFTSIHTILNMFWYFLYFFSFLSCFLMIVTIHLFLSCWGENCVWKAAIIESVL